MSEYLFKTDREIMICRDCPMVKKNGCPLKERAERRYGTCPLVEIPTHGELKNATHIINELERQLEMEKKAETLFSESAQGNAYMRKCRIEVLEWVIRNIKNQPTIVEASKETE